MSTWWFQLYTLPMIKRVLKSIVLIMIADQISVRILPRELHLIASMAILVPLFLEFNSLSKTENVEFHKMNVPFGKLKSYFLLDIFFEVLFVVISAMAIIVFSSENAGLFQKNSDQLIDLNLNELFFFLTCGVGFFISMKKIHRKYIFLKFSNSKIVNHIIGIVSFTIVNIVIALFEMFQIMHLLPVMGILTLTISLASFSFGYRATFHLYPQKANLKIYLQELSKGLAVAGIFYVCCVFLGRDQVNQAYLPPLKRISNLYFNGPLNPPLTPETFETLEPKANASVKFLYDHLDFEPSTFGIHHFIQKDHKEMRLGKFLKFGKPSREFLISLYENFSTETAYWQKVESRDAIIYLSYAAWPSDQVLPEKYLALRTTSEELFKRKPASTK